MQESCFPIVVAIGVDSWISWNCVIERLKSDNNTFNVVDLYVWKFVCENPIKEYLNQFPSGFLSLNPNTLQLSFVKLDCDDNY